MTNRTLPLVAALAAALLLAPAFGQVQPPKAAPAERLVSGVLKGAISTHDGSTDWIAILVGEEHSYIIVGGEGRYTEMKKKVGRRVVVRGEPMTEFRDPETGEMVKLAGKVAGIAYDGNLGIKGIDAVTDQALSELVGKVEITEQKSARDPGKTEKLGRIRIEGEEGKVLRVAGSAFKKIKALDGRRVRLKAYVLEEVIDAIATVTPLEDAG